MPVKVVDASALGAIAFGEPEVGSYSKVTFRQFIGRSPALVVRTLKHLLEKNQEAAGSKRTTSGGFSTGTKTSY